MNWLNPSNWSDDQRNAVIAIISGAMAFLVALVNESRLPRSGQ